MSTRANIIIRNGDTGRDRLLYHHYDGDLIGILLGHFIREVVSGDANDFADFLKDYTYEPMGYDTNLFEEAKVVSSDIDYIYYVSIYDGGRKKVVEGFKLPNSVSARVFGGHIQMDDEEAMRKLWDMFSTAADFTEERIRKYWSRSYHYVYGVSDDELGGAPHPKTA